MIPRGVKKIKITGIIFHTVIMIGLLVNGISLYGQQVTRYYVSPEGQASNSGGKDSPWSLEKANQALLPGETAILLDGTYEGTPIAPENSGSEKAEIIYRAANKHMAVFKNINGLSDGKRESNGPAAVFLNGRSFVVVDGIKVLDVKRWIVGAESSHITIKNCYFNQGEGWNNCRFDRVGNGIKIISNYFNGGTDLLCLDGGEGHIIDGNFFGDAAHTGLILLGVKHSVVKNNTLTNRLWRNMEIESQRHEPFTHSEYNLIENNLFDYSPSKILQYAGNYSILRRNIFRRANEGMNWANYLGRAKTPEAWHNEHNRFYNNVIAECGSNDIVKSIRNENSSRGIKPSGIPPESGYGMVYSTNLLNPQVEGYSDVGYGDNIVINNIFYLNSNTTQTESSSTTQIAFIWNAVPDFGGFFFNNLFSGVSSSDVFYVEEGTFRNNPKSHNNTILQLEQHYGELASNNIDADPLFVDPAAGDYRLKENSSCIDAGGSLTKTTSDGEGRKIPVEDALYFTDGYGLVNADRIRIGSQSVNIISIDYSENIITVDENISWKKSTKVYLDYEGSAPDLGAFEFKPVR